MKKLEGREFKPCFACSPPGCIDVRCISSNSDIGRKVLVEGFEVFDRPKSTSVGVFQRFTMEQK